MQSSLISVTLLVLLTLQSAAAGTLAEYFPTEPGRSWRYSTVKQTTLKAGSETRQTEKKGVVLEAVRHAASSDSATIARVVTENNPRLGEVRVSSDIHVDIRPEQISVVAVEVQGSGQPLQRFPVPQPLLSTNVPGPEIDGFQATVSFRTRLVSQSPAKINVPSGGTVDGLLTETKGIVAGSLNGIPVESGSITIRAWYAPGIGLTREERIMRFLAIAPDGTEVNVSETATKTLTRTGVRSREALVHLSALLFDGFREGLESKLPGLGVRPEEVEPAIGLIIDGLAECLMIDLETSDDAYTRDFLALLERGASEEEIDATLGTTGDSQDHPFSIAFSNAGVKCMPYALHKAGL